MSPCPALRARQLLLLSAYLLGLTAAQAARCPQYPNDVTVANDVDLNRLMGDIGYPYFKPQVRRWQPNPCCCCSHEGLLASLTADVLAVRVIYALE